MTEALKKFMNDSGCISIEEAANLFEITATEFSDTADTEVARDYMLAAATLRENEKLLKALANCYMLARRAVNRFPRGVFPVQMTHEQRHQKDNWEHIVRFCEETGMKADILRASVPTEITGG